MRSLSGFKEVQLILSNFDPSENDLTLVASISRDPKRQDRSLTFQQHKGIAEHASASLIQTNKRTRMSTGAPVQTCIIHSVDSVCQLPTELRARNDIRADHPVLFSVPKSEESLPSESSC
jgi:hypothetical protein